MNVIIKIKAVSLILVILGILGFSWSPFFLILTIVGLGMFFKFNIARLIALWLSVIFIPLALVLQVSILLTILGIIGTRILYGGRNYDHILISYIFLACSLLSLGLGAYIVRLMNKEDVKSIFYDE